MTELLRYQHTYLAWACLLYWWALFVKSGAAAWALALLSASMRP